jgi:predicted RNA-binding protein
MNGKSEVSNLEGAKAIAEDIVWLDVHDNDVVAVEELQALTMGAT